jgi:hypothetical protein
MSDELLLSPEIADDAVDAGAPTERDPATAPAPPPSRGDALSVLWWRESDLEKDEQDKPETD